MDTRLFLLGCMCEREAPVVWEATVER
ncbi:uncharacterized protein G2W53_006734 [Senna tora]|uniref:Uncharacterized protein n=1 Tax=Senna tora TaxID=362788 RepID=A0A834X4J3_9FABA|nr:uncharacterized protein G2W53_006734 [Senna tora]